MSNVSFATVAVSFTHTIKGNNQQTDYFSSLSFVVLYNRCFQISTVHVYFLLKDDKCSRAKYVNLSNLAMEQEQLPSVDINSDS